MELKPGLRLKSSACDTEIMVIKGAGDHDLRCGGQAMGAGPVALNQDFASHTLMGKRYVNEDSSVELLCTKPGVGSLSLATIKLTVKQTQALPSSD